MLTDRFRSAAASILPGYLQPGIKCMDYEDFIKKLAFSKEMNPFHDSFSMENFKAFFGENIDDKESSSQIAFAFFILMSNPVYKDFYSKLNKAFEKKANNDDYYLYSLSIANHDSIFVRKEMNSKAKETGRMDIIEMTRSYMDIGTTQNSIGNIMDGIGDNLVFNFNLIKFASGFYLQNDTTMEPVNEYFNYFYKSNIFCVLKNIYEKMCFENVKCEFKDGILYLRNIDESFDILKAVAFYRIESNNLFAFQSMFNEKSLMKQLVQKNNFNAKKIKNVIIEETTGEISVEIMECDNNDELECYCLASCIPIVNYHYHLPDTVRASLQNFLKLFSTIQYIASQIEDVVINKMNMNKDEYVNPNYSLFKMKKNQLIKYIKNISGETIEEINSFLDYVSNKGDKSFWEKPILANDIYYFFSIHHIVSANIYNIIDIWVNENKDYDNKGHDFEDFVKSEIKLFSKRKNYFCKIPEKKKYSALDKSEEIDLIWETKNGIIFAEIKNIRYPFTSRNINDYRKTLKHASGQIIRKVKFIMDNDKYFPDINLKKPIIKCIITNYPFFSGTTFNEIPVIDIGILRKYIDIGYTAEVEFTDKPYYKNKIEFYNNEDEYSDNMGNFFLSPEPVNVFKSRFQYKELEYDMFNDFKINVKNVVYINQCSA
jgi:hypothetical protein